jgi:hypothetical protein
MIAGLFIAAPPLEDEKSPSLSPPQAEKGQFNLDTEDDGLFLPNLAEEPKTQGGV